MPARSKLLSLLFMAALFVPSTAWAFDQSSGIDTGATAWMLVSTSLVLLMVPGLAMFYGGLVRTKNVLGTMMHCFWTHGLGANSAHASAACNQKAEGHQDNATIINMQGGNNNIMTSHPHHCIARQLS